MNAHNLCVLILATDRGWTHEAAKTPHGAISDQFTRGEFVLTCFWCETPWSDARWENAVLVGQGSARHVADIEGTRGVLAVLGS